MRSASLPFAVLLVVVAIPALEALRAGVVARDRRIRVLVAALVALAGLQFAAFVNAYRTDGPLRTGRFEAGSPGAARNGLGGRRNRVRRLRRPRAARARALVRPRPRHRPVEGRQASGRRRAACRRRRLRPDAGVRLRLRPPRRVRRLLDRESRAARGPSRASRAGRRSRASRRGRSTARGSRRTSGSSGGRPPPTTPAAASPSRPSASRDRRAVP